MGWVWIVVAFVALGVLCNFIFERCYTASDWMDNLLAGGVGLSIIGGGLVLLLCLAFTIPTQLNKENTRINTLEKREALIALYDRYDSLLEQDVTASESYMTVTSDILYFNKALRANKKWSQNPIFGSMFYGNFQDIEEIPLG